MISSLMAYAIFVSLTLSLAAFAIDRGFALLAWPRRTVWLLTLVASLAIPAFGIFTAAAPPLDKTSISSTSLSTFVPVDLEATDQTIIPETSTEPQAVTILNGVTTSRFTLPWRFSWPSLPNLDDRLQALWLTMACCLLLFYVASWSQLRLRSRRWPAQNVRGELVLVTDNLGPAVFGFIRPRILLPRWLLNSSTATRDMALAHEVEHIRARDQLYLALALLLVALAPWNLPMWWQLRRLRFAIEVDCDARVLRKNNDTNLYGEMLLLVGQQRSRLPVGAMAMAKHQSQLERRIRIMMTNPGRQAKWLVVACITLSASFIVAAAQIEAPAIKIAAAQSDQGKTSPTKPVATTPAQPAARQEGSGAKEKATTSNPAGNTAAAQGNQKRYSGKPQNFDFDDADLRTVFKTLAEAGGQNMVVSESVKGTMTLHLENVSWDQALDIVLRGKGLDMRKQGNAIIIGTSAEMATREKEIQAAKQAVSELAPLRTEFLQVSHAKASDLAALIMAKDNALLSNRGKVVIDERTNSLVLQDTDERLAAIRRFVSTRDIPAQRIETETPLLGQIPQRGAPFKARQEATEVSPRTTAMPLEFRAPVGGGAEITANKAWIDEREGATVVSGAVQITKDDLDLSADSAVMRKEGHPIAIKGSPATFIHRASAIFPGEIRGSAQAIDYDPVKNQLILKGDASMTVNGRESLRAAALFYDAAQRKGTSEGISVAAPRGTSATQIVGNSLNMTVRPYFKDVPITDLVEAVAKVTGKTFILDPRVQARVTLISEKAMTTTEFYEAFLGVLQTQGFVAAPSNKATKIMPRDQANTDPKTASSTKTALSQAPESKTSKGPVIKPAGKPEEKKETLPLAPLRTEFLQIKYAKAADLAALIKAKDNSLLSERGNVSIDERTNTLLLQDTGERLDAIRRFISIRDVPAQGNKSSPTDPKTAQVLGDKAPLKRIYYAEPIMPESARTGGINGAVEVQFTVTPSGDVADAKVRFSNPTGVFDEAALTAVRQWKYEPPMKDGQSTSVDSAIRLRFDSKVLPTAIAPPLPDGVARLKRIQYVEPTVPVDVRSQSLTGWVEVAFTVGPAGDVTDAAVRASDPTGVFDEAALTAVRQWKYEPPRKDGQLTSQRSAVRLKF